MRSELANLNYFAVPPFNKSYRRQLVLILYLTIVRLPHFISFEIEKHSISNFKSKTMLIIITCLKRYDLRLQKEQYKKTEDYT